MQFDVTVRLNAFEGPLDLLLYLIEAQELEISKVSITQVTSQYLDFVRKMQELDFDHASDFILMAATLILWKSKAVLSFTQPVPLEADSTEPELTPEALLRQLQERYKFRHASQELGQLPRLGDDVFTRPPAPRAVIKRLQNRTLPHLLDAYRQAHVGARLRRSILRKETVSIGEKMREIATQLQFRSAEPILISSLIRGSGHERHGETVATFLAALELARLKKISVSQDQTYGPILLQGFEELDQLDIAALDIKGSFEANIESALRDAYTNESPPMPSPA